jgi:hypothetical protein
MSDATQIINTLNTCRDRKEVCQAQSIMIYQYSEGLQKAHQIDELLEGIYTILDQDRTLSRLVRFNIKQKNHGDKSRFDKFFQFSGPDQVTRALLGQHSTVWMNNPDSFWNNSSINFTSYPDPQMQIVGTYVQAERNDA